ncbi:hypothetical protein Q8W71_06760 [Methylobacterium sp. NEAU 140]|nr:hypothetical protein [Methylobacterium sp. NEAU 140]MDP4022317.1 hypothetical protein [Methylobacterium sp. NEAU 140]
MPIELHPRGDPAPAWADRIARSIWRAEIALQIWQLRLRRWLDRR